MFLISFSWEKTLSTQPLATGRQNNSTMAKTLLHFLASILLNSFHQMTSVQGSSIAWSTPVCRPILLESMTSQYWLSQGRHRIAGRHYPMQHKQRMGSQTAATRELQE